MLEREHLLVKDFPVEFLVASGLTEQAIREASRFVVGRHLTALFQARELAKSGAKIYAKT